MSTIKNTTALAKRMIKGIQSGNYDIDTVEHMLDSLVKNRDNRITILETKVKPRVFDMTQAIVTGAIKNTIDSHGPITKQYIESASKRIYNQCIHVAPEGVEA